MSGSSNSMKRGGSAYPLARLGEVRDRQVDAAARDFEEETAREREASERRGAAEEGLARAKAEAMEVRRAEHGAFLRGKLTCGDLQRGVAWEAGARVELEAKAGEVEAAAREEEEQRGVVERARAKLLVRRSDAKVVENDRERWRAEQKKEAERREEEAMEEAWRRRP